MQRIDSAIQKGIDFLYDHQMANGEFMIYISDNEEMKGWNSPESTIGAMFIANSLLFLKGEKKVDKILKNIATFLRDQMRVGGTWNFFTRTHVAGNLSPNDVDDTAVVARFLKEMDHPFPEHMTKNILLANRRRDGLFYTWFTFRFKWNINKHYLFLSAQEFKHPLRSFAFWKRFPCERDDVDAVVNASALYYFGKIPETEPIISYLIDIIENKKEEICDKWYCNPFSVYYYFSRIYASGVKDLEKIKNPIIQRIKAQLREDGCIGNSFLDTTIALSSLFNLDFTDDAFLSKSIDYLLSKQNKNGSWNRGIHFYAGPGKELGYGSEELSTGFCLESLARYRQITSKKN
ncbi:prenyltransferase/squalene oxidase repeat-containing protein [Rhodohalobacter sp. 614A]|uniref:prenyltransferase/squalene oxidase repeat-containing protein n=1 Tax=Rhodohalobacter sp. 614A TaxID=2908649 RepID=UPI001F340187|nr:prenyltransferase/squalene oxidase repeat-containing protein [Rhodohalobacter sp. 614A]